MFKIPVVGLLFFVFLSSCGPKVIFQEKTNLEDLWLHIDKIRFDYEVSDISRPYDLLLNVTHDDDFSYENLYINVTTVFPDGKNTVNPVSLQLADYNGDWLGDCDGKSCVLSIEISTKAYFEKSGKYSLQLEQYSRKDSLRGIRLLELKILESAL